MTLIPNNILALPDAEPALQKAEEADTESLSVYFHLSPDAPEGVLDTIACLFVSYLADLFETMETAEPGLSAVTE